MITGVEAVEATDFSPRTDLMIASRRTGGTPVARNPVVDIYIKQLATVGENEAANKTMYIDGGLHAYIKSNYPHLSMLVETGAIEVRMVAGGYAEDYARWR